MCQYGNAIYSQGVIHRRKVEMARAFVVLCAAAVSVCGCGAAIVGFAVPENPAPDPPSIVFIGDSITALWGSGRKARVRGASQLDR